MSDKASPPDSLTEAFDGFRGETLPLIGAPGVTAVRTTVRRRRQVRAGAAVCAVAILGGSVFALANFAPPKDKIDVATTPSATATASPEPTATASPSGTPSPSPSAALPGVSNWRNAKLQVPAQGTCPGGTLQFSENASASGDFTYKVQELPPVTGDVTSDGMPETVLFMRCGYQGDLSISSLIVFAANGTSVGSIVLPDPEDKFTAFSIRGGAIRATVGRYTDPATQVRTYTWNGKVFKQTGGKTSFPDEADSPPPADVTNYDWLSTTLALPFAGGTVAIPGGKTCPTGTVTFSGGKASKGGCTYEITQMQQNAAVGDANGDGAKDILLGISAGQANSIDMWIYVYTIRNGKPALVGFVTAEQLTGDAKAGMISGVDTMSIANGAVSLAQEFWKQSEIQKRTFTWNGSKFVPNKAPLDPRADARP